MSTLEKDGLGDRVFSARLLVAGIAAIGYYFVWEPYSEQEGIADGGNSTLYAREPLRTATEDCQGVQKSASVSGDVCVSGYVDSETSGNKNLGARGLVNSDLTRGVWLEQTPSGGYPPYFRIRFAEPSSLSRVDFMPRDQSKCAFLHVLLSVSCRALNQCKFSSELVVVHQPR